MTVRRLVPLALGLLLAVGSTFTAAHAADGPKADAFVVKPYLQLGDDPSKAGPGDLRLLWQGDDVDADWSVEYQAGKGRPFQAAETPTSRRVAVPSIAPHRVYRVDLKGLIPGESFAYRVRKGAEVVFESEAKSRKTADQPYRFLAVGDLAQGTAEQKAIGCRMAMVGADLAVFTGDMVYARGRISEYREKYWPVYNADAADPKVGGPLLRSTVTAAAPGNHDVGSRDLEKYPDGLAYYYYWDQPRNGPESGPFAPPLAGPGPNQKAFLDAAGAAYPRLANFSFDYANAHWTVLDANPYVDWRDPGLRDWIARDLAAAKGATWRFVAFHHPGFNSAEKHFEQQEMRLIADVLEAGKVDVVFNGHVHNYQRSFPLRFVAAKGSDGRMVREKDLVPGTWTIDKSFDGKANTRPEGVIYLVTGGGGAGLYNPEQQDRPNTWQTFTDKFISKQHSITVADVAGTALTIRQLAADGAELDRFSVDK